MSKLVIIIIILWVLVSTYIIFFTEFCTIESYIIKDSNNEYIDTCKRFFSSWSTEYYTDCENNDRIHSDGKLVEINKLCITRVVRE